MRGPALRGAFVVAAGLVSVLAACSSKDEPPTKGKYTVTFPSTAAAVTTDFVQLLVFDLNGTIDRAGFCQDLITKRITTPADLAPSVPPDPATNICEMLAGLKPITIPYGEHALLAIGQRRSAQNQIQDVMIGCAVETIADGDAPIAIALKPVDPTAPLPATTCTSVGDFCSRKCQ